MNIYKYIIKEDLRRCTKAEERYLFFTGTGAAIGSFAGISCRAEDNSQTYKVGADDHTLWDRVQDGVFNMLPVVWK